MKNNIEVIVQDWQLMLIILFIMTIGYAAGRFDTKKGRKK